ncbi:hypothetical protein F4809DRAFT_646345 [Biscogniauxia mediterranea]|nr:hypothetical protein F4809DRAFT_646345 [Biscogniauxia mediterranea]
MSATVLAMSSSHSPDDEIIVQHIEDVTCSVASPLNSEDDQHITDGEQPVPSRWLSNASSGPSNDKKITQMVDAACQTEPIENEPGTNLATPNLAPDLSPEEDVQMPQGEPLSNSPQGADTFQGFEDDDLDLIIRYIQDYDADWGRWQLDSPSPLFKPSPAERNDIRQPRQLYRQWESSHPLWFDPEVLPPRYSPSHGEQWYSNRMLWAVASYKLILLLGRGGRQELAGHPVCQDRC